VLLQTVFSFLLQLTRPHAAYKSLLCMHYLCRPVARAWRFNEFRLSPLNELTAIQHVAVGQRRKVGVVLSMDTECSTSAVKSMELLLMTKNDGQWWP